MTLPSIETLKTLLRSEEGYREYPYRDTMGHLTVGIGFNLDRPDAAQRLVAIGLSYAAVRSGTWPISEVQALLLLDYDARVSVTDASDIVGPTIYGDLPEEIQLVLADMRYNMGYGGLAGFKKMITAVRHESFVVMAKEMADSRWAQVQVPARAMGLLLRVLRIAAVQTP